MDSITGSVCKLAAANLSRPCPLVSLEHEKDEKPWKVFDELSSYSDTLFYGWFDKNGGSNEDMKQEKNFSIIEYNACGAEAHHVYGNGNAFVKCA